MAAAIKDYTGTKFGKLVAIKNTYTKLENRRTFVWEFLCECGETVFRDASIVRQHHKLGSIPSCDVCKLSSAKLFTKTHGESKHWLHVRWSGIIKRCKDVSYQNYGGRGISVSEEFRDFQVFSDYVKSLDNYSKTRSIDRINPDGDYERGNLRWATNKEQSQNKKFSEKENGLPVGVSYRANGFYRASWVNSKGCKKEKSFSVKIYGEELSRFLAEEYRLITMLRLKQFGEPYSEFHGKFRGE